MVLGLTACTRSEGENPAVFRAMAESAAVLGRPDWQRKYLLSALAVDPQRADDWVRVGDASMAGFEGSVNQAIEAYRKCLALDPDHRDARLKLAKALNLQGDSDRSLMVLNAAEPAADVLAMKAESLYKIDPEGAWPLVVKAIETSPESEKPYLLAAKIAQANGDWRAMAEMALAARRLFPFDPPSAYLSVVAYSRLGDKEAQKQAENAFVMLREYRELPADDPQTASKKLDILKQLESGWIGPVVNLRTAELFFQLKSGQRKEALATWRNYGDSMVALPGNEIRQLIRLFIDVGWLGNARRLLDQAQKDGQSWAPIVLAELDFQEQHFDRVVEEMTERIERGDGLAPHYFNRARAMLWLGDEKRAMDDFESAVALAPWFAGYRIELAKLKLASGDTQGTIALLNAHAAANDPAIRAFMKAKGLGGVLP